MKRELLKGFTMVMMIVVIALATAVISANAQSARKVVAFVPFEFAFGDQVMRAGDYRFRSTTAPANGLSIEIQDSPTSVLLLTIPIERGVKVDHRRGFDARLVFHKYGNRYFLSEVWTGRNSEGRQLMKSRQERAIERELASITSKSELSEGCYEIVEVAAVIY